MLLVSRVLASFVVGTRGKALCLPSLLSYYFDTTLVQCFMSVLIAKLCKYEVLLLKCIMSYVHV